MVSQNRKTVVVFLLFNSPEGLYVCLRGERVKKMGRLHRFALLVTYQLTLIAGILLLPVALLTERFGVRLPIDRAITGLKQRYERTTAN